ncbi:flavodoxin family protein [Spirochaetia bacterium 38H-sp]|uniref:Flavodoxin family protein n=1 Tax=Rarispira pelagica TaxID=3141764 RepID=A0ABU9U9U0_9SPIR
MKVLLVYYSHTGSVEKIASFIKGKYSVDTLEIEPKKKIPTSGFFMFMLGGYEAIFKKAPPLKNPEINPGDYDLIIVGSPVWAGRISSPVYSFIKRYGFSEKKCAVFCCYAGNPGNSLSELSDLLEERGNHIISIAGFKQKDLETELEKRVSEWLDSIM